MHYNFCAKHSSLTPKRGEARTPAMAANLTDHKWTVAEMIEATASYRKPEAKPSIIEAIERTGDN